MPDWLIEVGPYLILAAALLWTFRTEGRQARSFEGKLWQSTASADLRFMGYGPLSSYVACGLVILVGFLLYERWQIKMGLFIAVFGATGLALDFSILRRRRRRRLIVWIMSQDYRVCTGCLYSLKGLAASGQCPECDQQFSSNSLRTTWREMLCISGRASAEQHDD